MIEAISSELLVQYGSLGLFVIYLIFDRQVLLKKLVDSIDNNTKVMARFNTNLEQEQPYRKF